MTQTFTDADWEDLRQQAVEVMKFFDWAYKSGDGSAQQLDYLPMPPAVKDMVRKSWAKVVGPDGKPVYR